MRWRLPLVTFYLIILLLPLSGCAGNFLSKENSSNFKEQLYVDARLNFAIKHPLDWKYQPIPVSKPEYRGDTIKWVVTDPAQQMTEIGDFQIRSTPTLQENTLSELLSEFLADMPELKSRHVEEVVHPAGAALKLLGHDDDRGHLIIAIKGVQRDFIISLDYPSERFAELLPVFEEIVASFDEILHPAVDN